MQAKRTVIAALSLGLAFATVAESQASSIDLSIEQQALGDGSVEYSVTVYSFLHDSLRANLTAPDGTVFDFRNLSVRGLDFQQLGSRFFGDWSIKKFGFRPRDATTHTFTLLSFTLGDILSEVPTVTSPALSGEQAIITAPTGTADFTLAWSYPSGAAPSASFVNSATPFGSTSSIDFNSGTSSALVSVALAPGALTNDFIYRVGTFGSLSRFVSPVVPDDPAAPADYTVHARFVNLSQPVTVTVSLPEPSSLALSVVVAAGLLVRLRN